MPVHTLWFNMGIILMSSFGKMEDWDVLDMPFCSCWFSRLVCQLVSLVQAIADQHNFSQAAYTNKNKATKRTTCALGKWCPLALSRIAFEAAR